MTGRAMIAELTTVTSRLIELMDAEVACLRKGQVGSLTGMQQEKMQLAAAYEAALTELRKDPPLFAAVAPAVKDELLETTNRLHQAIDRNGKALAAARDVNRRLMDSIVKAATVEQTRNRGYGRSSAGAGPVRPARHEAVSIALDQRL